MRGFSYLLTSVGFESLLGNSSWFSQSLMRNHHAAVAFAQVGLEGNSARLNWLLTFEGDGGDYLPNLLDNLSLESALHGACCLLAAASADADLFVALRQAGFCRYSWQRFWHIQKECFSEPHTNAFGFTWERPQSIDALEINNLRRRLISPSVYTIWKITGDKLPQYVLKVDGQIMGFASVNTYGSKIIATPLITQTDFSTDLVLQSLFARFFSTYQTAYLIQTSDQAWLEDILYELGEPLCEREELLVKHFSSMQKVPLAALNHTSHSRHADTIAPIMKTGRTQDNI